MTGRDFLRTLFCIFSSPGSAMLAIATLTCIPTPADCESSRILQKVANRLAVKIAVFSDDPTKFRDPRFAVTDADQLYMLAPIGHAITMEPVLLEYPDDRPVDDANRKYGITSGTTFMVSPCIALTNYHVVFGQALEQPGYLQKEYKVKVSIGEKMGVGVPFIWGHFDQGPQNDWAAIRVTPCIGSSVGWLPMAYTNQRLPREVSIFGFYGDEDYSVLAGQDCVLTEKVYSAKIWRTNCAMMHGTSGSPIGFFQQGSFRPTAMAFAMTRHKTQTITYDPQDANLAIDLFGLFLDAPSLAVTIADELKAYGIPNPAQLPPTRQSTGLPPTTQPRALPPAPEPIGLPPTPQPIRLPPTPQAIGLPPTPQPVALPPTPQPIAPPPHPELVTP